MAGEWFAKWANDTNKQNRNLLRGRRSGGYHNFDKSYITDYILTRRPLIFKEATPEYMEKLRYRLQIARKKEIRRKFKVVLITAAIMGLLMYTFFNM